MTIGREATLGLFALALAGVYFAGATTIQESLLADAVGADGVPRILAAATAFVGAALLLRGLARPRDAASEDLPAGHLARAGGLLAILVAYLVLVPWIGYLPAIAGLLGAVSLYAGAKPGRSWALMTIGGALFFWLLFTRLLGISMPASPFA